jgi:hypothetical protein
MPNKLYDLAGASGLISTLSVWILLAYFRIGGTPVFILIVIGLFSSYIFVMRQAVLQRRFNEFGSLRNLLMACSWWFVAMVSVPVAMIKYFGVLASIPK